MERESLADGGERRRGEVCERETVPPPPPLLLLCHRRRESQFPREKARCGLRFLSFGFLTTPSLRSPPPPLFLPQSQLRAISNKKYKKKE